MGVFLSAHNLSLIKTNSCCSDRGEILYPLSRVNGLLYVKRLPMVLATRSTLRALKIGLNEIEEGEVRFLTAKCTAM